MTKRQVKLHAGWITRSCGLAIIVLATAHLALQSIAYHLGLPGMYGLVRLFDMGVEGNLPTFFSCVQLLVVSLVLMVIGLSRRQAADPFARHWLFLALIFLLLAADEMAEMHEMSIRPIRELVPWLATGVFYWAWVLPGALFVLLVGFSYARFVFRYLPQDMKRATLVGGSLFVGGAIGVEMPEAMFAQRNGIENFTYSLFVLVEETMEMTGILVFLSGLLRYVSREVGVVALEVVLAAPSVATTTAGLASSERPAH